MLVLTGSASVDSKPILNVLPRFHRQEPCPFLGLDLGWEARELWSKPLSRTQFTGWCECVGDSPADQSRESANLTQSSRKAHINSGPTVCTSPLTPGGGEGRNVCEIWLLWALMFWWLGCQINRYRYTGQGLRLHFSFPGHREAGLWAELGKALFQAAFLK